MRKIWISLLSCFLIFMCITPVFAQENTPTQPQQTEQNESKQEDSKKEDAKKQDGQDDKKQADKSEQKKKKKNDDGFEVNAKAGLLIDANSGKILYAKNEDEKYSPNSLAKLLELAMSFNKLKPKDTLTMSNQAFKSYNHEKGVLWIQLGETLSVKDLQYATMLTGANDTMAMLAEGVSESNAEFLKTMNQVTKNYKMSDSHFENIFGLYDEKQVTTCIDLSKMLLEAFKNKLFKECFETRKHTIEPTNLQANQRMLVNAAPVWDKGNECYVEEITGAMSSYTQQGGGAVIATAKKGGLHLVGVILEGESSLSANKDMKAMMKYGLSKYQTVEIHGEDIGEKKVPIYRHRIHMNDVIFHVDSDFTALLPADIDPTALTTEIEVLNLDTNDPDKIEAEVVFQYNGKEMARCQMDKQVLHTAPKIFTRFFKSGTPILDVVSIVVLGLFIFAFVAKKLMPPQ